MRCGWPIIDATRSKHKRPRATRYPFIASVLLFDLDSGGKTAVRTSDLSVFGCLVVPGPASRIGARVRIQITYMREVFEAVGRVIHALQGKGVGIVFTKVEHHHQLILEKWLAELRSRKFRTMGDCLADDRGVRHIRFRP